MKNPEKSNLIVLRALEGLCPICCKPITKEQIGCLSKQENGAIETFYNDVSIFVHTKHIHIPIG